MLLRPLGPLAAAFYRRAVEARNRRFEAGNHATRLPLPVVSVGNLSVGGTGKTPMVRWVVLRLQERGRRPIIAMRGYKARPGGKSDEQLEHETRLPETPVIAHPKRAEAVRAFLDTRRDAGPFDCCVLDDGFQHRQVARDLDIVLIEATRSPFEDRLLPAGTLREPVENLARADAVVLTGADLRDEARLDLLRIRIGKHHGRPPIASFRHVWTKLRVFSAGKEHEEIVPQLARRRLLALCAIAHPERFLDQIELHGGIIVESVTLPDHARYDDRLLRRMIRKAGQLAVEAMITTEKDWMKLRESPVLREASADTPVIRPELEIEPIEGEAALTEMIHAAV